MPLLTPVAFFRFVLEYYDFRPFDLVEDLTLHLRPADFWFPYTDFSVVYYQEDAVECNGLAGLEVHFIDFNRPAFLGNVLFST